MKQPVERKVRGWWLNFSVSLPRSCQQEMLHTKLLSLLEDDDIHNYRQCFSVCCCLFFALTRTGISFLFRRMCWWCWCFSQKAHVLVPQERTYLSLKIDGGNLKHVRVGVSLCFSPNFQTCFGCEKNDASRDCHFPASCDRLLLNMQHLPLRLENCHGPVWPMNNMEIPWNGSWLKRSNFFWGGGFFGWKFTYSSRLGFVKNCWCFFTDSKPWDSSPWDGNHNWMVVSLFL